MDNDDLLNLFHNLGKLKNVPRAGWLRSGISENESESVAEHTFRTACIAMVLGDILELDTEKLVRLALLHDLAELEVGDITPYENMTDEEKTSKESTAMQKIFASVQNGEKYLELWNDFANQDSEEAKLIKNIDKFEMALQAAEYQSQFPDLDLKEFLVDAEKQINIEKLRELFESIKAEMIE